MRYITLLSKQFISREEIVGRIKNYGDRNYRVIMEDTYSENDIDLYKDVSDKEFYLISFDIVEKEEFNKDNYTINGEDYFIYLVIGFDIEMHRDLVIFIDKILTSYPEMYVTDEAYSDFYNIRDIESGSVPEWLKV